MTEEIAAAPGWVDERLDGVFASLPQSAEVVAARNAYLDCLAAQKSPAAPSDMLGAEFNGCRSALLRSLRACHAEFDEAGLKQRLETLEAELVSGS